MVLVVILKVVMMGKLDYKLVPGITVVMVKMSKVELI